MELPRALDLSRFNFYAPLVKHLVIAATPFIDEYSNWKNFLACTRSISLLPNLEQITMEYVADCPLGRPRTRAINWPTEQAGMDAINWVTAFLSTSLRELHISTNRVDANVGCCIYSNLACNLLQDVSQKCHRLDTLTFLPGSIVPVISGSINQVNGHEDLAKISSIISSFGSLRTLSMPLVNQIFSPFTYFPRLESLSLHCLNDFQQGPYKESKLSKQSYPSLKSLQFCSVPWPVVLHLCDLNPLVRYLESIRIVESFKEGPSGDDRFSQLVSCLAKHNSPISSLSVQSMALLFNPPSTKHLLNLPLTSLSLGYLRFDSASLSAILASVPMLEELIFWGGERPCDIKCLGLIILSLPRVAHLSLSFQLRHIGDLSEEDLALSESPCLRRLYLYCDIYLPKPVDKSAEKVARFKISSLNSKL